MANKVLVGVGIGCGVLVLLGVVVGGVGFFWAKKTLGGAMEAGQQMAAQDNDLKELEKSFPFTAPPEGEVLALQEARLNDYFSIREAALPVFKELEQKAEGVDTGEQANIADGLKAGALLAEFMSKTRGVYIENLKKHRMSPREFHAITTAIYSSALADSMGQMNKALAESREQSEKMLADLREQLADSSLSEEERANLEQQESAVQEQIAAMAEMEGGEGMPRMDEKAQGVAAANVALLKKFDERIKTAYNPAFDALVLTPDMQGGGFQHMMQVE